MRGPNSCMMEPALVSASPQNDNASETLHITSRGDAFTYSCSTAQGCLTCPHLRQRVAPWFAITSNRDLHQPTFSLLFHPSELYSTLGSTGGSAEILQGTAELQFAVVRRYLVSRFRPSEANTILPGRCLDSPNKIFPQNTPKPLQTYALGHLFNRGLRRASPALQERRLSGRE